MMLRPGMVTPKAAVPVFPVVQATAVGSSGADSTYATPLPSGITAGDLLIVLFTGSSGTNRSFTTPTGWTALFDDDPQFNNNLRDFLGYYKVADGSEGSTVSITANNSSTRATLAYRISGASGTVQTAATADTGSSTGGSRVDISSLSPSWGSKNTLWLAISGMDAVSDATAPTGFTDAVNSQGSFNSVSGAIRNLAASSLDPDGFAAAVNSTCITRLIAIEPA